MKHHSIATAVLTLFAILGGTAQRAAAQDTPADKFTITKRIQAQLDVIRDQAQVWVDNPALVAMVQRHNETGPIDGMTNAMWKRIRPTSPQVTQFIKNPAAAFLRTRTATTKGLVSEVFLNDAAGDKIAFLEKTSSYCHRDQAKFSVPFTTGKGWQGKPEFDASSRTNAIQLSVPVRLPAAEEGGRPTPIGVLVVGIDLEVLARITATPAQPARPGK